MKDITKEIAQKVIEGNGEELNKLINKAIKQNLGVEKIMEEGFIAGLNVVGEKFTNKEYFLPDMLVSGMVVQDGLKRIRPLIAKSGLKYKGIIVAGTVLGDMHDIGKKIVCMMLEGAGFEVFDIGIDISAKKFIDSAIEKNADAIVMSALLSTTRLNMGDIIREIHASKLDNKVKIIVGGASVTQGFADKIGADGYAKDAGLAILKIKEILNIK